MKGKQLLTIVLALGLLLTLAGGLTQAQGPEPSEPITAQAAVGTAFTYQGRLTDGGSPASGTYDFRFRLYDAASGGTPVSSIVPVNDWTVTDGLFTVPLDFGSGAFNGDARYLEISVRPGSSTGAYTTLTPRQALTPAPYALALPGLWTQQNATSPNLIGGYSGNSVTAGVYGATIGGGGQSGYTNRVTDDYGTVGGGDSNRAGDNAGTTADSPYATVGGGGDNTATGDFATVGGGEDNTASGLHATVGGGTSNTASGWYATVGGGISNTASGNYATVPGGWDNTAQGDDSFAAGHRAKANNQGCFVWGDSTPTSDVSCTTNNRTIFRSSGGYYIYTNSGLTSGMYLAAGGSSWNAVSSRQLKENLAPVDAGQLLERLAQVEIGTWNYKAQDPAIRHIGPMADDFNALVDGLGGEGMDHINSLDADGVALASIQELYRLYQEQKAENAALRRQVSDLEARLAALEQVVSDGPQAGGGER